MASIAISPGSVALRPIGAGDMAMVRQIFDSSRADLANLPLPEPQKTQLMDMQFRAQEGQFHSLYPAAHFDIVLVEGVVAGRLYVDYRDGEFDLIDIALLPQYRGQGVGSALLRRLLDQAADDDCRVVLQVARNNPALRLYERFGFTVTADSGVYFSMQWDALAARAAKARPPMNHSVCFQGAER